jgi:hypothetical protein
MFEQQKSAIKFWLTNEQWCYNTIVISLTKTKYDSEKWNQNKGIEKSKEQIA